MPRSAGLLGTCIGITCKVLISDLTLCCRYVSLREAWSDWVDCHQIESGKLVTEAIKMAYAAQEAENDSLKEALDILRVAFVLGKAETFRRQHHEAVIRQLWMARRWNTWMLVHGVLTAQRYNLVRACVHYRRINENIGICKLKAERSRVQRTSRKMGLALQRSKRNTSRLLFERWR